MIETDMTEAIERLKLALAELNSLVEKTGVKFREFGRLIATYTWMLSGHYVRHENGFWACEDCGVETCDLEILEGVECTTKSKHP